MPQANARPYVVGRDKLNQAADYEAHGRDVVAIQYSTDTGQNTV